MGRSLLFLHIIEITLVASLRFSSSSGKCLKGAAADQARELEDVDVFMRSYRNDINWFQYPIVSLSKSMDCTPGVIRDIHVIVPKEDVKIFKDEFNRVWKERDLPEYLRKRWSVTASKVKVSADGYQEQMLDKIHADFYVTDVNYVMFVDSDTVLARDVTRDQLFDDRGLPYLCFRSVDMCGGDCASWMEKDVRPMLGGGDMIQQEYMCSLGQAYQIGVLSHLRSQTSMNLGSEWDAWVHCALSKDGCKVGWVNAKNPESGFTEFNAIGAVLWRDFRDEVHWLDAYGGDHTKIQARPVQSWSWEKNQTRIEMQKRKFDCLIEKMHDTPFDYNSRTAFCEEAVGLPQS